MAIENEDAKGTTIPPPETMESYPDWAYEVFDNLEKLNKDTKNLRYVTIGIGGMASIAIAIAAGTAKMIKPILEGVTQLNEQQKEMGAVLSQLLPQPPDAIPMGPVTFETTQVPEPSPTTRVEHITVRKDMEQVPLTRIEARRAGIPDPTIDATAPVAEPVEGPVSGVSDAARALMEADGHLSLKDDMVDPLDITGRHVNLESKNNNNG